MKKRVLTLVCLCLACILFFTACSSTSTPSEAAEAPPTDEYAYEEPTEAKDAVSQDTAPTTAPVDYEKKIVRNADITMEVVDVEESYAKIMDWAKAHGGYESSSHMINEDKEIFLNAIIKIKAENLDAFLAHIKTVGKTINSEISSDEVTDQYYDLETRIKTMRKTLEKYYTFLEETKTVKEMLEVQNAIDNLTVEIEALEGKLNLLKAMVAESSVTISLYEQSNPAVAQEEEVNWSALSFGDMLTLTGRMFVRVGNFLVSLLQWIVILSPFLILLLIFYIVIRLLVRRHRKKHPRPAAVAQPYYPGYNQPQSTAPPVTAKPANTTAQETVDPMKENSKPDKTK